jgi:adenylate kinase family enzyme
VNPRCPPRLARAAALRHLAAVQRIVVMGPPGSGKSTLARTLGARLGLPVFHLDQVYWQPGWVETPLDHFQAEVARIAALPAWVIDGNYTDTIGPRFAAADTVIYLDVPTWLSVYRLLRRMIAGYGRVRADSAPGCAEYFDMPFLRYAWSWNRERRTRNLGLVESFPGCKMVVRTGAERRRLLAGPG